MSEQAGRVDSTWTAGMGDTLERILREVETLREAEDLGEGETLREAEDAPRSPPPAEGEGSTFDDAPPSAAGARGFPSGSTPPEGNPLGALLGGLASNPALLTAIPTLMENLGPLLGGGGIGKSGGGAKGGGSKSIAPSLDRHTALLCAVKPYLGSGRQEAAEKIIRLCRAWDALQKSGMTDLLRGFVHAPQTAGEPKGRGGQDSYV